MGRSSRVQDGDSNRQRSGGCSQKSHGKLAGLVGKGRDRLGGSDAILVLVEVILGSSGADLGDNGGESRQGSDGRNSQSGSRGVGELVVIHDSRGRATRKQDASAKGW